MRGRSSMRAHEIIVLGAMAGDADRVGFLEGVRADQMGRHLAGDADQRNGIHQGVGEAGDGVGRAGAGGDEQAADLAGRAGVAFRRMGRALLVAHQYVLDLGLMEKRVIDRQDRAAGIAEQGRHALDPARLAPPFRRRSSSSTLSAPELSLRFSGFGLRPIKKAPFGTRLSAIGRKSGSVPACSRRLVTYKKIPHGYRFPIEVRNS